MYKLFIKRTLDLTFAGCALIVLSPLFIVLICVAGYKQGLPIFFRQQRVGRYRKSFDIIKFRTMSVNKISASGTFDAGNTSRVTKLGRILRHYKLDELPQLINVVKGDMAIVGPRPEILKWTEVYPEVWDEVLSVRPGITDWASVAFRHESDILSAAENPEVAYEKDILPVKLEFYKEYASNISFINDVSIMFSTAKTILK